MKVQVIQRQGYQLLHDGIIALAEVEANGIRIDVPRLEKTKGELKLKIRAIQHELEGDKVWRLWQKQFGAKTNITSGKQLATILYDKLDYPITNYTEHGQPATDDEALQKIDHPFVKKLTRLLKYKKALGTFLKGIEQETVDGFLHPFYNLHIVRSFRSSSDSPNFQNFPVRDKEISEIIRQHFIARPGCVLVEKDYKGIEVFCSACHHHDPNFIAYITTPGKDMHRDMAAQIYCLKSKEVSKDARYGAKNKFVFPQFYGDYYVACARNLWDWIDRGKLTDPDGKSLYQHLKRNGITELGNCDPELRPRSGTFEKHLKEIEDDFWNRRFRVYGQWRKDFYEDYLEKGYFDLLTGFRVSGFYSRNQVTNIPIQGCLAGESRVFTSQGWIPIKKLVGKCVKVWNGFKWADAVGLERGKCQRVEVSLSSGLVINCDTRHKFKNEVGDWVDFKNIKVGDRVALHRNCKLLHPSKEVDWWFIFGFIIGDGCISAPRGRKGVTIHGGKSKEKDLQRILRFFEKQGYKNGKYGGVHFRWNKKGNKCQVSLECVRFVKFLERHGFVFGWKSKTKEIPASVWTASRQEQRNFLYGLQRSDGFRGKWTNGKIGLCNENLIKDLQVLASGLGLDSGVVQDSSNKSSWRISFSWRRKNARPTRKYPMEAIRRHVPNGPRKEDYINENQYITDRRSFKNGKVFQYGGERILEKSGCDAEIYRYDIIKKIKKLSFKDVTYTMSVDDSLHQFVADGVLHKNSAFHCLLWSLIRVNKLLKKYRMKSLVVGQIHDSMLGDVPERELKDYLELVDQVTMVDLRKEWDWINVPLEVETEICPIGGNWFQKREVKFKDGKFFHPDKPEKFTTDAGKLLKIISR